MSDDETKEPVVPKKKKTTAERFKDAYTLGKALVIPLGLIGTMGMGFIETLTEDEAKESAEKAKKSADQGMALTLVSYKEVQEKVEAIDADLDDQDEALGICLDAAEKLEVIEEIVYHLQEYHDKREIIERLEALERGPRVSRSVSAPVPAPAVSGRGSTSSGFEAHALVVKEIDKARGKKKKRKDYAFSAPEEFFWDKQQEQKIPEAVEKQIRQMGQQQNQQQAE